MLAKGQETPNLVRPDGSRFVLVEGLRRLEACKVLGETTVPAYLVRPASINLRLVRCWAGSK
jgi:sulfiredoxin